MNIVSRTNYDLELTENEFLTIFRALKEYNEKYHTFDSEHLIEKIEIFFFERRGNPLE